MEIPKLPSDISPDGREVWAWADSLSKLAHKNHEMRQLSDRIRHMTTECGSCRYWMTNDCPRETHDNRKGHKVGPSSRATACSKFQMNSYDVKALDEAKAKLAALAAE